MVGVGQVADLQFFDLLVEVLWIHQHHRYDDQRAERIGDPFLVEVHFRQRPRRHQPGDQVVHHLNGQLAGRQKGRQRRDRPQYRPWVGPNVPTQRGGKHQSGDHSDGSQVQRSVVTVDPLEQARAQPLAALHLFQESAAALIDQVGADVADARILGGCGGQIDGRPGHAFLGYAGQPRNLFDRVTISVPRGEVHVWVDRRRILSQDGLDPALFLKDFAPVQKGKLAQARNRVFDRDLLGGLSGLLLKDDVSQRASELALQPAAYRDQSGLLVYQVPRKLESEEGTRVRLLPGHLGEHEEQLIRIAAGGGQYPIRPEVGNPLFPSPPIHLLRQPP